MNGAEKKTIIHSLIKKICICSNISKEVKTRDFSIHKRGIIIHQDRFNV